MQPPVNSRHTTGDDGTLAEGTVHGELNVDHGLDIPLHQLWHHLEHPNGLLYQTGKVPAAPLVSFGERSREVTCLKLLPCCVCFSFGDNVVSAPKPQLLITVLSVI